MKIVKEGNLARAKETRKFLNESEEPGWWVGQTVSCRACNGEWKLEALDETKFLTQLTPTGCLTHCPFCGERQIIRRTQ